MNDTALLALDVGQVRIGVALASSQARLARPLTHIPNSPDVATEITELISTNNVTDVVVGLPRGLDGQETAQTKFVRDFAAELAKSISVPMHFQDEALTSHKAEEELNQRGKSYAKGDVDALAACYILDDFLSDQTHASGASQAEKAGA